MRPWRAWWLRWALRVVWRLLPHGRAICLGVRPKQGGHVQALGFPGLGAAAELYVLGQDLNEQLQPLHVAGLQVSTEALAQVPRHETAQCQHADAHGAEQPKGEGVNKSGAHEGQCVR